MHTRDSLNARRTVSTLMAMSILGWTAAQPALSQATPKRTHSVLSKSDQEKKEIIQKSDSDWDSNENDPTLVDPAPLNYPFAAPGAINMNHWTDYTRTHMAPGSAQEEREARRELMYKRMMERQKRMKALAGNYGPSDYNSMDANSPVYQRTSSTFSETYQGQSGDYRNGSRGLPAGYQGSSRDAYYMGSRGSMGAWTPMATYGDYVYIVRGNTLLKLNSSDLSVVKQQELPAWTDSPSGGNNSSRAAGSSFSSSAASSSASTSVNGQSTSANGQGTSGNGLSVPDAANSSNSSGVNNSSGTQSGSTNGNGTGDVNSNQNGGNSSNDSSRTRTNTTRRRGGRNSSGTMNDRGYNAGMYDGTSSGMGMMAPVSISAGNDYVYVLRGNTLIQLRTADLSVASSKSLPSISGYDDSGSGIGGSNSSGNSNSLQNGQRGNSSTNGNGSGNSNGTNGNRGGSNGTGSSGGGGVNGSGASGSGSGSSGSGGSGGAP